MKKSNIIYASIVGTIILAIILYFSLRHTEGDGHVHADGETHTEESHSEEKEPTAIKEVELNEAQFKASSIELGTFSDKNLSEVIKANGYTKLPPQNQADVSVFTTGIVKTINVVEGQRVSKGQTIATIESPEFTKIQESYLTSKSNLEYFERARFNSLQKQLNTLHISGNGNSTATVPVIAPISGNITEIYIKIGSNVEAGKPLMNIVDNSKLHVDLLVYEKDLFKVKQGQNVRFILTNQDNTEINGKIFSVGKSFENETKSVAVHADISNNQQKLIPGMYVNALIDAGANTVKALPSEAIIKADGREFIFVLEEGHKEEVAHDEKEGHNHEDGDKHEEAEGKTFHFQRIEVKSGTTQLGYTQVTLLQKIDPNAKIVLKGAYYIQSHLIKNEGGGGHAH